MRSLILSALLVAPALAEPLPTAFLQAKGNTLQDQDGRVVQLRGVNLGGWLVIEPWMCPMDSSGLKDEFSARDLLAKRFGEESANDLFDTWQESWIKEDDLDKIAALGLNAIRIPISYRTLQSGEGAWLPDGFKHLDRVIAAAWKRGIYSVIDLHGAPGGQTKGHSTGRIRPQPELWNNETHLRRTSEIWEKVAAHYRGNPAVAAYDLLNEPSEAPSLGTLWATYDRLYRAVRAIDPHHVITVEACINTRVGDKEIGWGWEALPHPGLFGWTNMLYQLHHYEWDWNSLDKQNRGVDFHVAEWDKHRHLGVPAYMGEFNPMARPEAWVHAITQYDKAGMSWTFWSYKATHGTGTDSWGLYNPIKPPAPPNLATDDLETIRTRWSGNGTTEGFQLNPMIEKAIRH
jgi:endo-1,4-beta-mannosidase